MPAIIDSFLTHAKKDSKITVSKLLKGRTKQTVLFVEN